MAMMVWFLITIGVLDYHWGSCVSNRAGKKNILLCSEEEAKKTIEQMIKRRKSRGYELITPIN